MKKNFIYVQILLWSAIAIFGLGILGYSLMREVNREHQPYVVKNQDFIEEFVIPIEGIEKLDINLVSEDFYIKFGNTTAIEITHYSSSKKQKNDRLDVTVLGNRLKINKQQRIKILDLFPTRESIEVILPRELLLSVRIETVSGNMNVGGGVYGQLELSTVSGNQYLEQVEVEQLIQNTTSGNIRGSGMDVIRHKVKTVSGDIENQFASMPKEIVGKTISGDLEITLPTNPGFVLEYETVSGDVDSDFEINWVQCSKTRGTGIYNDKVTKIVINTVSGDIEIKN